MSGFTAWSFLLNGLRTGNWQWKPVNQRRYTASVYGSSAPVLVDTDNLMQAYIDCPHLNVVINKRAEMLSNGEWKCVSNDEEEKEFPDDPGLKLLNNPNPLQRGNSWLYQYSVYRDVFATNFIYPLRASSTSEPKCIWHLPSEFMKVKPTGKQFKQWKIEDIIQEFILCSNGREEVFKVNEVIYNVMNPGVDLIGQSKIPALKYPISNIVAALKTRNMLIVDKGVVGFISTGSKGDGNGLLPVSPDERERIENQFAEDVNLYGDKAKIKVTTAQLTWNAMSYPVRDLMLLEECEDDFSAIIAAYNLDRDIFPSVKGATFENKNQGMKASYEQGIIPTADDLSQVVTRMLLGDDTSKKYILDYSWLPVMQEDMQVAAQRESNKVTALHTQFADGVITNEEYRIQLDLEPMPEVDAAQSQLEKILNAQVELRGTVGGTTGLIAVNQSVSRGELDRDAAVAIVVNIYGFDPAIAETMITRTVNKPEEEAIPLNQQQDEAA